MDCEFGCGGAENVIGEESIPMFSVVIPLYNKEQFIKKTLESVFAQKFQDYEVLVINDGSTDNSPDISRSFNDKRLRVIDQENNGVSSARNRGAEEARGRWVAFLDGDDIWSADHLLELSFLIEEYPRAGLVSTTSREINFGGETSFTDTSLKPLRKEINYFRRASEDIGVVNSSSVAVLTTLFKKLGGFLDCKIGEDLEFWARVALVSVVAKSSKHTVIYLRGTAGAMEVGHLVAEGIGGDEVEPTLNNLSPSVSMLYSKIPELMLRKDLYDSVVVYINSRLVSAMRGAFVNGEIDRMKRLSNIVISPCDSVEAKWFFLAKLPRCVLASLSRVRKLARGFYWKLVS